MTPFPRTAFCQLSASLLSLAPQYVTWKDNPEPSYGKPPSPYLWASMRIGSSNRTAVGTDDLVRVVSDDGSTMAVTQTGRRVIVLGIDLTLWSSPVTDGQNPEDLLENYLAAIWQPPALTQVNAMSLVLESPGPILPVPYLVNGRRVPCAHVDLTVALAVQGAWSDGAGNVTVGGIVLTGTTPNGSTEIDVGTTD